MKDDINTERVLGLELETSRGVRYFTFPPGTDRIIVVGSSPHADVTLPSPDLAPVEFLLERCGEAVCVLPALESRPLLVNARHTTQSVALEGSAVIDVGAERIVATAFDATGIEGIPLERPSQPNQAYVAELPSELDSTRVGLVPVRTPPPRPELGPGFTQRIERPRNALGPTGTEVLRRPLARPAEPLPPAERKPVLVPSLHALTTELDAKQLGARIAAVPRKPDPARTAREEGPTQLSMPSPGFRARLSWLWRSTRRTAPERSPGPLAKLGTLTRRRPVLVAVTGILVAGTLAAGLVAASRLDPQVASAKARRPSATASRARAPASAVAPASSESLPAITVMAAPLPDTPPPTKPKGASAQQPIDAQVSAAVTHFIGGRDEQARAAYAELSRRTPSNLAYAAVARQLGRLAAPECSGAERSAAAPCPAVKR